MLNCPVSKKNFFFSAYTLDLKHHFCLSAAEISPISEAWRQRALQLEAELRATRAAASSEHIGTGFQLYLAFLPPSV